MSNRSSDHRHPDPGAHAGESVSLWMDTADVPVFPALDQDREADVCVVGAGIAGLSAAYHLAQEGLSVIVLDDGPIGGGQSERTTAHITHVLDDRYMQIEKEHGEEKAALAAESHTEAIETIARIVREEKIDCAFERVDGYLFLGPDDDEDLLKQELDAAQRAGLTDARRAERAPLPSFETGPCLRFPNQAQFHIRRYLSGLAKAAEKHGARICTGTHVSDIHGGAPATVRTSAEQTVTCKHVVIATNAPIHDSLAVYTRQAPYLTYVIGLALPAHAVPRALYWDTQDPYHYVRVADGPQKGRDVLVVGGEDHKTGQQNDAGLRFARLEAWTRQRFPECGEVLYRWSGQVMEPSDGMALIGRNPLDKDNVYIATGDSGNGMTHGTIAGLLLTDLICRRENPWEALYSPSRIRLRALGEFAKENANVAGQYTDLLKPASGNEELQPCCGRVIQDGIHKIALYKDETGTEHRMSAICPHKGCVVRWNSFEKTWDCPCHGSRYAAQGQVINGPSIADLKRL
jgi:glycine/D-amino acid oxidase-like deaminating enzyme/nitrite reductase/ring-hydroxylating ferredoxin subunit